jgi:lipoprotein-anchoring transpeptidase ErfK/SrfK
MRALLFLITALITTVSYAQNIDHDEDQNLPPADYVSRPFVESDFKTYPWLKEFINVIVINKANAGSDKQSLRIYVNGKLKEFTRISSGRETFEKGCAKGQDPKKDHCSKRAYWSQTPTGYFDIDELVENYFSNLWQTWMPYAVFFESGIATHQAPGGTENNLGSRASGGCVRMHPSMAPVLYAIVKNAGKGLVPRIGRNGEVQKTAQGDVIRWQGYKSLVIVHNTVK